VFRILLRSLSTALLLAYVSILHANDEPYNSGWALHLDNDLFVAGERDQDYTGGVSLTLSGSRVTGYAFSLDGILSALDKASGINRIAQNQRSFSLHAFDTGFALFTPSDITQREPQKNDHPYASLFFIGNVSQRIIPPRRLAIQSSFTLGLLGLPLARTVQSSLHDLTGSERPKGWEHQISEGGEPTARYSVGIRKGLLQTRSLTGFGTELNLTAEANAGFTTDLNTGFSIRFGRLSTPWWSFAPHQAEYVNLGTPSGNLSTITRKREFYVYAGGTIKYRLYNALLQGQFRDSAVFFDSDELEPVIAELWTGISYEFGSGLRLGAFARGRTAELEKAIERSPMWGGITLSKSY